MDGAESPKYLTMQEAAEALPGKRSPLTVWRWCSKGIKTPQATVKLKHIVLGRAHYTTKEWLDEFGLQLAADRVPVPSTRPDEVRVPGIREAIQNLKDKGAWIGG